MPTSAVRTWTGLKLEPYQYPQDARMESVVLAANLTLAAGTVLGRKTADGKYAAYADGAGDGTQVAMAILPYAVKTDANGKITLSDDVSTGGEQSEKYDSLAVYVAGYFKTTDLTGLDAAGVADLGRIVAGTLADGVLQVQG